MENSLFKKLQETVERPCRSKEWFPMAEQAINTIYALGERPDLLCSSLIKNFTQRVFSRKSGASAASQDPKEKNTDAMDEDEESVDPDITQAQSQSDDTGDAFELSQLLFIVGHVAIKQIVFLELVEREWKRQKHEKELGGCQRAAVVYSWLQLNIRFFVAEKIGGAEAKKDQEELDQVAGNAEDEIGERIATMREVELLYGAHSLLSSFGPLLVHICGSPHKFKASRPSMRTRLLLSTDVFSFRTVPYVQPQRSRSASFYVSAHNIARRITASCSRSLRRPRTLVSVVTSSSPLATSPSLSAALLTKAMMSSTRDCATRIWSSRRTHSWS